jgi:hypothetical protein
VCNTQADDELNLNALGQQNSWREETVNFRDKHRFM